VEDDVTVYANATILGGQTTVGASSIVGGSVFLAQSVAPHSRVAVKPPELQLRLSRAARTEELPLSRAARAEELPKAPVDEHPPASVRM
jgi:acetyltransferase-like isoleucine patch superfamily enzyme